MSTVMVRIDKGLHEELKQLAERDGETLQGLLARAVEEYRTRRFWDEVAASYTALRSDPTAWQEEQEERALLEGTLMDGLDRNEVWYEDGSVTVSDAGREKDGDGDA